MKINFSIDFILGSCGNNSGNRNQETSTENKNRIIHSKSKLNNDFVLEHEIKKENHNMGSRSTERENREHYFSHFDFLRQKSSDHMSNMIVAPAFDPKAVIRPHYPNYCYSVPKRHQTLDTDLHPTISRRSTNESDYDPRRHDPSAIDMSTSFTSDESEEESKSSRRSSPGYYDHKHKIAQHARSRGNRIGRRLFTGVQILELENVFSTKQYLTRTERAYLSQKVNLTECQIKTWFQNRRTKEKRRGHSSEEEDIMAHDIRPNNSGSYFPKPTRVPGYGIQVRPTFGPPDKHLKAAIVDFLKRKSPKESCVTHS